MMDTDESGHIYLLQPSNERLMYDSNVKILIKPLEISKNKKYNPCCKEDRIVYQEQINNIKATYQNIIHQLVHLGIIYNPEEDMGGYLFGGELCSILRIVKETCQREQYRQYAHNDSWVNFRLQNVSTKIRKNPSKNTLTNHNKMDTDKCGYIYLIWPYEYYEKEEYTYKIGRTSQENNKRFNGYMDGTIIIYQEYLCNTKHIERTLIDTFKQTFHQHIRGNEYFNGNLSKMLGVIKHIIQQEQESFCIFI